MLQEQSATIDVATMKNLLNPAKVFAVDEDFLLVEVRMDGSHDISPYRSGGLTFFFCLDGAVAVHENDKTFTVKKSCATVIPPTALVKFERNDPEDDSVPVFLIATLSQKYLFDLKIDMGELFDHMRQEKFKILMKNPVMRIGDEISEIVREHFDLIHSVYLSSVRQKKYHFTLLISSMLNIVSVAFNQENEIMSVLAEQQGEYERKGQMSRSKTVFADFMKLAVENFETERSIQFYADKLCLTPKYLSKLIKDGCGSSASALIDNLVIAKAKHLLKHTDYSVKLVAAKLNFSTQSSFNKFFKAKTGTSPLKFRSM